MTQPPQCSDRRCPCHAKPRVRIRRTVLMRLLPGSRLYVCTGCGNRVFRFLGINIASPASPKRWHSA